MSETQDVISQQTAILGSRLGTRLPQTCVAPARRALVAGTLPSASGQTGAEAARLIRIGASTPASDWLTLSVLARRWAAADAEEQEQEEATRRGASGSGKGPSSGAAAVSGFFRSVATAPASSNTGAPVLPPSVATAGVSGLCVALMAAMWPLRAGSKNPLAGASHDGGAAAAMHDDGDDDEGDEEEDAGGEASGGNRLGKGKGKGGGNSSGAAHAEPAVGEDIPAEALPRALAAAAAVFSILPLRGARAACGTSKSLLDRALRGLHAAAHAAVADDGRRATIPAAAAGCTIVPCTLSGWLPLLLPLARETLRGDGCSPVALAESSATIEKRRVSGAAHPGSASGGDSELIHGASAALAASLSCAARRAAEAEAVSGAAQSSGTSAEAEGWRGLARLAAAALLDCSHSSHGDPLELARKTLRQLRPLAVFLSSGAAQTALSRGSAAVGTSVASAALPSSVATAASGRAIEAWLGAPSAGGGDHAAAAGASGGARQTGHRDEYEDED